MREGCEPYEIGSGPSGKSQGGAGGERLSSGRALCLPHCPTTNNYNRISGFSSHLFLYIVDAIPGSRVLTSLIYISHLLSIVEH